MKPLVSIITVCYNSEKTLAKTIESVLNQTYDSVEYLIVDGKSTDQTVRIAESYNQRFRQKGYVYKIISERDKGIYDAMNKGIQIATGELVGIINSDDWYEVNALEQVVKCYMETAFDMFYADIRIHKNGTQIIKHSRLRNYVVSRDWNHPTTFLKRTVYDKFQYKLESIHDDWDLYLRIRNAGYHIEIRNEVLANFSFGGVSNERSLKKSISRGKARYKIYRNNGYSRFYMIECFLIETVKFIVT